MKMSQLLANTLRDNPAEAEVVSHQLLIRAGYIRRVASGIYNYLPLMWRVMRKVETIVREEMDRAGAQELLMPILQPAELWQESGRWEVYGKELIRLQDRHGRDCVMAPTHEEVITTIAKNELHSYRNLPVNLYQIQNKYRDEIRPRFGLLRGREFIMKDAYSFHTSQEDLEREYQIMADAYTRIFERCGLKTKMVRSDSGAIGGSVSHEFMVLTNIADGEQESGENEVFYCDDCGYAANGERAESILSAAVTDGIDIFTEYKINQEIETPNCDTIEKLCKLLDCPASLICKTLVYIKNEKIPFLVLLRGDREVEETKLKNALEAKEIRLANSQEISKYFDTIKGYIGIGKISQDYTNIYDLEKNHTIPNCNFTYLSKLNDPDNKEKIQHFPIKTNLNCYETDKFLPIVIDYSIANPKTKALLNNFVIGYEETNFHLVKFNWPNILTAKGSFEDILFENSKDISAVKAGDNCINCNATLKMTRGIEVGNIFDLGTKYSEAMNATYTAEDGTEKHFIMGCYGIGVSRTAAAAVEGYHDKWGIVWPMAIAPYQASVIAVNTQDDTQMTMATQIYDKLREAGIEVVFDDRDERAGVKFKDADLIGFPIKITAGKRAGEGLLEVKMRDNSFSADLPIAEVLPFVQEQIKTWQPFATEKETATV